ncbi:MULTISPECIES: LysR family transcriptional regulator [Achromobacter]|uniref:HTH-type transcriptional regulator PgrR n=1 Tax=Achromobacter insolitus TaxID=217204 RepID=A0A6S7F3M1_9BURK|nr:MULTISPECIES: LysR family transcriptional regulator [Achromobacter]GLK97969.1 LysR family transcriptional regulator [Achromobacter xylosoxidans]APX73919.1 LysR family transcriptional regulator [Achromobacter insolitus]AVG38756.1 LysR family transcriptional regulator [Achromobacter insolitus]AXA69440.1 LysR family transcriptional regulator [Achromobacter insolitus]MEB3099882.1 LysR family transcriptional regulator [Achromobacter sp. D10]
MDRFQEMQVFVRIAERGSFSKAAEDLQIPRPTVTNLVKRMEARLGARLLERTTRQVRLTHDGEAHYRRCVRLLADLEEADGAFLDTSPKGLLRVNAQGTLTRFFVMPGLPAFLERYPDIVLQLGEDDRLVDLVREGVDCVLRTGVLQDSSLAGRQIALMPQVTVASPAYLERFGEPRRLEDLESHQAVNYLSSATGRGLPLDFTVEGRNVQVRPRAVVSVTGAELYTSAALAGLGLVQVPRYRVERELAAGELKIVLPGAPPAPMPVSVLYPQNRQVSARVRVFTQWLAEVIAAGLAQTIPVR